jgi:hypothetical protein
MLNNQTKNKMNLKEAVAYMKMRFTYESELVSYAHDLTDTGVFNKKQFDKFPKEVKIEVAKDLKGSFCIENFI